MQVEPAAYERSRLHLGDGLVLEVDDDGTVLEDDGTVVEVALFWPPAPHVWTPPHPDEPLDDDHATVWWAADGPVVTRVPSDPTLDPWIPRTDGEEMQLRARVVAEGLEHFVDVVSGFDRARNDPGGDGALLWRGRATATGHAALERFLFDAPRIDGGLVDSRSHDRDLAVRATVDLRLWPPPTSAAVAVPSDVVAIDGSRYCAW